MNLFFTIIPKNRLNRAPWLLLLAKLQWIAERDKIMVWAGFRALLCKSIHSNISSDGRWWQPLFLSRCHTNLPSHVSSSPCPWPAVPLLFQPCFSPRQHLWSCQIARWFCDRHKWGLGWDHPTCFHLQAQPGCKPEPAEEKADSTNPLCHLACTLQKSYSAAASASFSDVLKLFNNQPPKNCSFPAMTAKFFCLAGLCCHRVAIFFTKHLLHPIFKN